MLERVVWQFLQQDYPDKELLILQNHPDGHQMLDTHIRHKGIRLFNMSDAKSLGEVYQRALPHITGEVVTHMDDDDQYLYNHLSAGVAGFQRALVSGDLAYKPHFSWYRTKHQLMRQANVMEPSIFVHRDVLESDGYKLNTKDPHWGWLIPTQQSGNFYEDPDGPSTFVYDWSEEFPAWKASGDPDNPDNFANIRRNQQDHGDGIVSAKWTNVDYAFLHQQCGVNWPHEPHLKVHPGVKGL